MEILTGVQSTGILLEHFSILSSNVQFLYHKRGGRDKSMKQLLYTDKLYLKMDDPRDFSKW